MTSQAKKNARPEWFSTNDRGGHAIVIGGSMAGLLAGRVLANHFERVTLIERDGFPDGPEPRPGIPQARHVHALMKRGRDILEQLFPGIENDLVAAGASVLDAGDEIAWLNPAGWGKRFSSGLRVLAFTRDLLDWIVRSRLSVCPQVSFLSECAVKGLLSGPQGVVTGVSVQHRNYSEVKDQTDHLYADLVVDAGGRASRMPHWLYDLGYAPPSETIVNAHLGYASRLYQPPAEFRSDWKALFIQAAPPRDTRAGLIFPVEGNRWIVTLGGGDRDYPPTDETGFLEFARSLRSPLLFQALSGAKPLSAIYGNRSTENRLRHYEQLDRWPERLIVLGDAACAFNPVYGQGMTTAALEALLLDKCLLKLRGRNPAGNLSGLARTFQRQLPKVTSAPWMLATSEDYRYGGTEGADSGRLTRWMHRYMDQVLLVSTKDARVRKVFLQVQQMLKSPLAMFHPKVAARVLGQMVASFFNYLKVGGHTKPQQGAAGAVWKLTED